MNTCNKKIIKQYFNKILQNLFIYFTSQLIIKQNEQTKFKLKLITRKSKVKLYKKIRIQKLFYLYSIFYRFYMQSCSNHRCHKLGDWENTSRHLSYPRDLWRERQAAGNECLVSRSPVLFLTRNPAPHGSKQTNQVFFIPAIREHALSWFVFFNGRQMLFVFLIITMTFRIPSDTSPVPDGSKTTICSSSHIFCFWNLTVSNSSTVSCKKLRLSSDTFW